ncbi:MAG: hypothetical protein MZV64_13845 [Ignavibacteriales bacterium]|nr:hypothetical protein [Ignavibacteriales bacterium]
MPACAGGGGHRRRAVRRRGPPAAATGLLLVAAEGVRATWRPACPVVAPADPAPRADPRARPRAPALRRAGASRARRRAGACGRPRGRAAPPGRGGPPARVRRVQLGGALPDAGRRDRADGCGGGADDADPRGDRRLSSRAAAAAAGARTSWPAASRDRGHDVCIVQAARRVAGGARPLARRVPRPRHRAVRAGGAVCPQLLQERAALGARGSRAARHRRRHAARTSCMRSTC